MPASAGRVAATAAIVLIGTAGGVGWLYLLRDANVLGAGPALSDALALDRLAGGDAQPLVRVLAAFVPAGLCVAAGLRAVTSFGPAGRVLVAGVGTYALLIAVGAASDAVTRSEPLARHLAAQPARAAAWLPASIVALCAYALPLRGR